MSNAPIISSEVGEGIERAPGIGRPNLQVIPGGKLIEEAMLASIARTAFIGGVHIPQVSSEALKAGNDRVLKTYGDQARRLLIIGHDTVITNTGEPLIIKGERAAELLGPIILERRIVRAQDYYVHGFFSNANSQQNRRSAGSAAAKELKKHLVDAAGEPLITSVGHRGSSRYGMEDVVVRDIRHTKAYKEAREKHARGVVTTFVLSGGRRPSVAEPAAALGTRAAMRELVRDGLKNTDEIERFRQMNDQITAVLTHRTDEYNAAHVLVNRASEMRSYVAHAFADAFDGDWQIKAKCKGPGSDLFFSPINERKKSRIERESKAKAICATCPIIEQCLERALSVGAQEDQIWGGKNKKEREAIIEERREAAEEAQKDTALATAKITEQEVAVATDPTS